MNRSVACYLHEILINDLNESTFFCLIWWRITEQKDFIRSWNQKKKRLLERFIWIQNFKITHLPKISFDVLVTGLRKPIKNSNFFGLPHDQLELLQRFMEWVWGWRLAEALSTGRCSLHTMLLQPTYLSVVHDPCICGVQWTKWNIEEILKTCYILLDKIANRASFLV